ncbi:hypothetical protein CsSME_00024332 [Camellia sinensis var. sinensis]
MESINVVVDDIGSPTTSIHEEEDGDPQILDTKPQSQGETQGQAQEGEPTPIPMASPSPKSTQRDTTTDAQITTSPGLKPSVRVKLNHLV